MDRTTTISWIFLVALTVVTLFLSGIRQNYAALLIMIVAASKFLVVGFQFMELKRAHPFWKFLIVAYVVILTALLSI